MAWAILKENCYKWIKGIDDSNLESYFHKEDLEEVLSQAPLNGNIDSGFIVMLGEFGNQPHPDKTSPALVKVELSKDTGCKIIRKNVGDKIALACPPFFDTRGGVEEDICTLKLFIKPD